MITDESLKILRLNKYFTCDMQEITLLCERFLFSDDKK